MLFKLHHTVSMAMGKIKAKGSVTALLKMTPLLKKELVRENWTGTVRKHGRE